MLLQSPTGQRVDERTRDEEIHAPAHLDSEVLSALGRMERAGQESAARSRAALEDLARAPIQRHALPALLLGAWNRRGNVSIRDALYVELASQLGAPLITTDQRLAAAIDLAELIS